MQLSARNQIPARITSIKLGEAIANVHLDANGVSLVASITVDAVQQLGLAEGANVTAVIKASDVIPAAPATDTGAAGPRPLPAVLSGAPRARPQAKGFPFGRGVPPSLVAR